jgi:predicted ATPase
MTAPFLDSVRLIPERVEKGRYPFDLPAVRALDGLRFETVTYFVGENGSGKSTVLETLAVALGFNAEGGTRNFRFATRSSESPLHQALRPVRRAHPRDGFFLRAESFFNVASEIDRVGAERSYGGRSLHEQSHGESFLALMKHRFGPRSIFILASGT